MYFTISSMTELSRFSKTGSRWRPGCQIEKNQNCSKWHLKNFTRISYIHFWKFHRFEPKEAGWLKPSNINLVQLLLVANTTSIMIAPYFTPPYTPTHNPTRADATSNKSYILHLFLEISYFRTYVSWMAKSIEYDLRRGNCWCNYIFSAHHPHFRPTASPQTKPSCRWRLALGAKCPVMNGTIIIIDA